ncbi:hypothetical protein DMN91_002891, partial [Ooceraea biroi]
RSITQSRSNFDSEGSVVARCTLTWEERPVSRLATEVFHLFNFVRRDQLGPTGVSTDREQNRGHLTLLTSGGDQIKIEAGAEGERAIRAYQPRGVKRGTDALACVIAPVAGTNCTRARPGGSTRASRRRLASDATTADSFLRSCHRPQR